MFPAEIIQFPVTNIREQHWREAGWRLLSACFHYEGTKEIQELGNEYWAAVRGMRVE
jgi:hypothetical protein